MRIVYLIGTSHKFQVPGNAATDIFRLHLRDICTKFAIVGIGEEMNPQALAEGDASRSICEEVARELQLAHCYCDPDMAIRAELGIRQENAIRAIAHMQNKSPEEIEAMVLREGRQADEKREYYWREKILEFDRWPLMFVCGTNHVENSSNLFRGCGINVQVVEADWAPD